MGARMSTGTGNMSGEYQAKKHCGSGRLYIGKIN